MSVTETTWGVPGSKQHTPAEVDEHAVIGGVSGKKVFIVDSSGNQIDGATEAKQDDIITELQKKSSESTTPTEYNITLTTANTEYSQALPANTKEFRFRCRTLFDVRYSFTTGKVATPAAPYFTLPAGSDYYSDSNDLTSKTLYLASSEAGVIVELEIWV